MDEKIKALQDLGWSKELIEHFTIRRFPDVNATPIIRSSQSRLYETNTMTIQYDLSRS